MMETVRHQLAEGAVEGECDPEWSALLDCFIANFSERGERGASLCIRVGGETKVDIWGGVGNRDSRPWTRDSVSVVFSATKGATALCAHILASRGELDLDAPVTRYWPEYGKHGKDRTTVAMLLNHSAGVPGFREQLAPGGLGDWDYMISRIEDEEPWWEPGSRNGYHLINIGWTVGEVVRRVSGLSLGTFFAREVAAPLGLDFWIGLPEDKEAQVIDVDPFLPGQYWTLVDDPLPKLVVEDPGHPAAVAITNMGEFIAYDPETGDYGANSRLVKGAEIGGAGGVTNARGLAGMYDPLATGGGSLVSADHVWKMSQVSMASHQDPILRIPTRFALGYMKAMDNRRWWGPDFQTLLIGDRAFGHVGAGGSLGMADPDCGLSFGYTMNRMGPGSLLNPRGQALVDATYRKLGYRSSASGIWAR